MSTRGRGSFLSARMKRMKVSAARQRRKRVPGDRVRPEEISSRERTRKTRNATSAAAPGQSIEKSFAGPPSGGEK